MTWNCGLIRHNFTCLTYFFSLSSVCFTYVLVSFPLRPFNILMTFLFMFTFICFYLISICSAFLNFTLHYLTFVSLTITADLHRLPCCSRQAHWVPPFTAQSRCSYVYSAADQESIDHLTVTCTHLTSIDIFFSSQFFSSACSVPDSFSYYLLTLFLLSKVIHRTFTVLKEQIS